MECRKLTDEARALFRGAGEFAANSGLAERPYDSRSGASVVNRPRISRQFFVVKSEIASHALVRVNVFHSLQVADGMIDSYSEGWRTSRS
jgi:hypothetical protein